MKIIAFIKEQAVINKILEHIGEPTEVPTFSPARGPPEAEEFGHVDLFDDDGVEVIPAYEMDQTIAW